jgi:hypothetical protein
MNCRENLKLHKTNSVALSPQAKYTDWETATCRRILVPAFVDREMSRGQRGGSPMVVNLSFLDRPQTTQFINIYERKEKKRQTPWLLVRKRTIPTERLPLVGEF